MKLSVFVDPSTHFRLTPLLDSDDPTVTTSLRSCEGTIFPVYNGIADLIFPRSLDGAEESSRLFYEGRADQYEETLHLTFKTHGLDEATTRKSFIDKLAIGRGSKVLEIACGTGRDSIIIAECVSSEENYIFKTSVLT